MPITDLTGYTWVANDGTFSSLSIKYINFTSNGSNYSSIKTQEEYGITALYYGNDFVCNPMSGLIDPDYETIVITGGTDVTNTTLISWLESNGTLTAPQPTGTNNVSIGTLKLAKAFVSNNEIASMWLGNVKIYEKGETPSEYEVQITFQDGYQENYWVSTEIYDNYILGEGSWDVQESGNKIGEILSANGTTTVTTTTGKICIKSQGSVIGPGTSSTSQNITDISGGDGWSGVGGSSVCVPYIVNGNGTITVIGIGWDF